MRSQRERHHTSYCYGPIVQGELRTHHPGGGHVDEEPPMINLSYGRVSGRASEPSRIMVEDGGGLRSVPVENIRSSYVFRVKRIL